jgi:hypothetical protein
MRHRLLPFMFIMSVSFCFISAETNTQTLLPNNNTSQQDPVITIDVKPTVDQDAFFKSLLKDIDSDRVEYKDGKIYIYKTAPIEPIFFMGFITCIFTFLDVQFAFFLPKMKTEKDIMVKVIIAFVGLIFLAMTGIWVYVTFNECINRWIAKNSLITLAKDGIRYKNERLISWDEIRQIAQYQADEYSSLTLSCTKPFGSEEFRISGDRDLPIDFSKMSELIYQVFYHMKQKQISLENPVSSSIP